MIEHTFESWWETQGKPYEEAVLANGGTPWTTNLDDRKALWERRYTRPAPPAGLSTITDIRSYQK